MKTIILAQKPFLSVQGEGKRTGVLTIFVRFAGCNLRCPGFFQEHPTQPDTYIKNVIDIKNINTLDDFPVVEYGCDTLYAIDPKYKKLWTRYQNVDDLIAEIEALLPKKDDQHTWVHPITGNGYDICFTGGEPLLHQDAITQILGEILKRGNTFPHVIQFETNGTQEIEDSLNVALTYFPVLFNVSPKLFSVTGEPKEKTWFPEKIKELFYSGSVSLKFVVNDTKEAFDELDLRVKDLNEMESLSVYGGVFVMPVGSSYKQQTDYDTINRISNMAVERGYQISGRLHCILFGNEHTR